MVYVCVRVRYFILVNMHPNAPDAERLLCILNIWEVFLVFFWYAYFYNEG